MAKTIDLVINSNGVTVLNQTTVAADGTVEAVKSLNKQYSDLKKQQEQYKPNTKEFKELTNQMVELKKQMKDSADAVNQNAQPAIEGLRSSFGMMRDQMMNLDFEGLSQSLNLVSGNLARLKPEDIGKGLKSMAEAGVNAFKAIGRAIIANPILAVAAAIIGIAMNFDRIVKHFPEVEMALTGINEQQRQIAKNAQAQADASKKIYDDASLIENSLRLQGKTEKEILQIRMKKLETSIKDGWVNLQIQEQQAQAQIDAAKRNGELLQLIIKAGLTNATLGLRLLAAPIDLVLAAANKVSEALGFGTVIAFNINEEISKLINKGSELASGLIFDPAAQEKELKDNFDKQRHDLDVMQNDYNGYVIAINEIDQKALDDKKAANQTAEEAREKELEANAIKAAEELKQNQKLAEEKLKIQEEYIKASQGAQANELYELEKKKELELQTWEGAEEDKVLIIEKYRLLEQEINQKYDDAALQQQLTENEKKKAADQKAKEDELAREKQLAADKLAAEKQLYEARWALATASVELLGTLFQKNKKAADVAFALDKALAIAKIVVDTQAEIGGYYLAGSALGPAGTAIATTQALAAKIRAAASLATIAGATVSKFMNGGGNAANGGGGGTTGGMQAPSPANFNFLGNQPNQQPPLQAYIVGTQVSSNLEAQQLIQNQSRLGG